MTDFKSLDPQARAYALVGQFLQTWSILENHLHHAIQAAMKISDAMRYILCANLTLWNKLHILRTLVDVSSISPDEDKEKYKKLLRDIGDYSTVRNMIAHDPFDVDDTETGVLFLSVKAKGNFGLPEIIWSGGQFAGECAKIDHFSKQVEELQERLKDSHFKIAKATEALAWPKSDIPTLGLLDLLSHPHPSAPGSHQATEEKKDETPQVPEEKA
jgi:hypothetical protein